MKCQGCTRRIVNEGLYIGETARSIGTRIGEHLNQRQELELKELSSCGNDEKLRQVTEAILIKDLNQEKKARMNKEIRTVYMI